MSKPILFLKPKHPGGIDTPSPLSIIPKFKLVILKKRIHQKILYRTIGNIEKIGEFILEIMQIIYLECMRVSRWWVII